MYLVRLDPLRDFDNIHSTVNRFFNSAFGRFFDDLEPTLNTGRWSPSVDVSEVEDDIVFTVELPGFEKHEIDISVKDGRLIISGERKFSEKKETKYHQLERWHGSFYRSFTLPTSVDDKKISANLKNGVLTVKLPKKEEVKPRQISVSVS